MFRAGGPAAVRRALGPGRPQGALAVLSSWRPSASPDLASALASRLGRRCKAAVATLDEVLEAAKEGDAVPGEVTGQQAPVSHISGQQGVLWFANIYPTKAFRLDFRQSLTHHNHQTLIPKLLPDGVEVLRMVPREREGGAFVYFRAPPAFVLQVLRNLAKQDSADPSKDVSKQRFMPKGGEDILAKVCSGISQYLKTHEVHAFLCPSPVRAHRVLGKPYLEDLAARYPGSRLRVKVEPAGAKVSEEQIYTLLRKYGVLEDLEVAAENKGFSAAFRYTAAAVAARNCLHRAKLESLGVGVEDASAELHIEFEPFMRKWLREAVVSNARYTIPLFVFCLMGTTYFIWDPLRALSVQIRLAGTVTAPGGTLLAAEGEERRPPATLHGVWGAVMGFWGRWSRASTQLRGFARQLRGHGSGGGLLEDFWEDREEEVRELRQWLSQPQDRVMLLTGYRGNGQNALVHQVLGGRAVYVDVGDMLERGGSADDHIFLRSLCRSLGYWPAQGMDRQMTALLDLMLPGSGKLSRENEVLVAVQRILSCVTKALTHWRDRQADGDPEGPADTLAPLFVIEGFTSENKDRRDGFFAGLVSWAAYVSEHRLARVLFIADSSFAEPAILAALRDRPERLDVQQLRDADLPLVRRILEANCGKEETAELTDEELAAVGGRFRDIAALIAHVREGFAPRDALRRLIETAESAVRTLLMTGQPKAKWTRPQLWRAVKLLATAGPDGSVAYDVFLWSVFRGDEAALRSMKESNLIAVVPKSDPRERSVGDAAQMYRVFPGSPLYAEVYRRLTRHQGLAAVLDLEVAKEDIKREQATLEPYEDQLVKLQEVDDIRRETGRVLADPNRALRKRKEQLLTLIEEQHSKLDKYHAARRSAQAVLNRRVEEFKAASGSGAKAVKAEAPQARRGFWSFLGFA